MLKKIFNRNKAKADAAAAAAAAVERGEPTAEQVSDSLDDAIVGTDVNVVGGRYELLKTIGQGKFGKVKLARDLASGAEVAVKIVSVGGRGADSNKWQKVMKPLMAREKQVLQALGTHRNIVTLHDVMTEDFSTNPAADFDRRICFVMDAVNGKELFDVLIKEGRFSEERCRDIFTQMLEGLRHVHNRGVYHRDLKPENILLDNSGVVKLIDFGLAAQAKSDTIDNDSVELQKTACGSSSYAAPEVLKGSRDKSSGGYDPVKADIWSAGVILYTMLTGTMLLYNADKKTGKELSFNQYLKCVNSVDYNSIVRQRLRDAAKSRSLNLSQNVLSLLLGLLKVDPTTRFSVDKALDHPWITGAMRRKPSTTASNPMPARRASAPPTSRPVAEPAAPASKRQEFRKALVQLDGPKKKFDVGGIGPAASPRCSPMVMGSSEAAQSPVVRASVM
jgi:5'-AMP-activated protein kinase catalytic alpha subunit